MNRGDNYFQNWQRNRINFILEKFPNEFFKGKRILELGPYNGVIGNFFKSLGADVHLIEGNISNVEYIKYKYPNLSVEHANLDVKNWIWGKWDIIINFGLLYHLEFNHQNLLKNCVDNSNLMFLESVIYDSPDVEIYFRNEEGDDQSLSNVGGTPSSKFVEEILKNCEVEFNRYDSSLLNGDIHYYDWVEKLDKSYHDIKRRFWIIKKNI